MGSEYIDPVALPKEQERDLANYELSTAQAETFLPADQTMYKPGRKSQLVVAIIALVGSVIVFLAGLCSLSLLVLVSTHVVTNTSLGFLILSMMTVYSIVGVIGGLASGYHSIRALKRKPSAAFTLPRFWTFLILYVVVIMIAAVMACTGFATSITPLTIFLILLAAILPAAAVVALGIQHIHFLKSMVWPTTWRRFIVALISGATMAITLALILEELLSLIVAPLLHIPVIAALIALAVIPPLVEETVKPLGALVLIRRIYSAGEAFVLGMACGVGFGLVETVMYISSHPSFWLVTVLIRSSACLLHGFGAGMVTLGWYYLTHKNSTGKANRFLIAASCVVYAILQHAIWNGWDFLLLLPFFDYTLSLIPLMVIFFLYVTQKLRTPAQLKDVPQPQMAA